MLGSRLGDLGHDGLRLVSRHEQSCAVLNNLGDTALRLVPVKPPWICTNQLDSLFAVDPRALGHEAVSPTNRHRFARHDGGDDRCWGQCHGARYPESRAQLRNVSLKNDAAQNRLAVSGGNRDQGKTGAGFDVTGG